MTTNKKTRHPDHVRSRRMSAPTSEQIEEHLTLLLKPAVYSQLASYRQLGLRERILSLPLMVAATLTLIWRQVPSVHELARMLARDNLLWCTAVDVSQQALSQRLLAFAAGLFASVLQALLPTLQQRQQQRTRPLPVALQIAKKHFEALWIADGSTLEAVFRKLDSLQEQPAGVLGGKICTLLDMCTHLPVDVWFEEQPLAHDTTFWPALHSRVRPGILLVLDRGFYDFGEFARVLAGGGQFLSRMKKNTTYVVVESLSKSAYHRERTILLTSSKGELPVLRLVEVKQGNTWYSYLTSVLDPTVLPPFVVADLYSRRWNIETAFGIVKRLLGLSYLWTGSINGVQLQVWASWLFYSVLVDLSDAVAEALSVEYERISQEMVYRGLYHFCNAANRGIASDVVEYLSAPKNKDLGVLKTIRKPEVRLNVAPHPT
ncbi:IS4 family transposase [Gloeobacter kilaueensis]|uniref:Transposase IS4 family protein n=1 Tax=Gloeobacter kilaueensis (strain ATCC BAA-2537 / CCAP 1431/1 / ULC 316 / JS1) TaxID=1183438 RepID=U5QL00_GLOK1|nr:IS4 family transposase [Gloeobacter kilaueensis]AGY58082.1 transposase IS4 family protein [Gloeobacter kilaueensis JS1]AGY59606.1 transposase IS4 family protein [Gloeobacter kilaueensis JS1]